MTAGFYAKKSDDKFVSVLSKMLKTKLGYSVKTYNNSQYGGTLSNGLNAIESIQKQKPDFVTIEFGTNDLNEQNNVPVETFKTQLNELIDGIQENRTKKAKIVLVTTWNQGDRSIPYDEAIKSVGRLRDIPVADISDLWKNSSNKGPKGETTFKGINDAWHPNNKGHREIAEKIFEVAKSELE